VASPGGVVEAVPGQGRSAAPGQVKGANERADNRLTMIVVDEDEQSVSFA
jgi:hypothetical protein